MSNRSLFISELIQKQWKDHLTIEEQAALDQWVNENPENQALLQQVTNEKWLADELHKFMQYDSLKSRKYLTLFFENQSANPLTADLKSVVREVESASSIPERESTITSPSIPIHRIHLLKTASFYYSAAIIIIIAGLGAYFWNTQYRAADVVQLNTSTLQNDVAQGGNRAVLTLADGSTIVLDSVANGQLAKQGTSIIRKTANGQILYTAGSISVAQPVAYNKMSTPRGGQYQLTLPDGSRVWLNAASSITYPTVFSENKRQVSITGEAYFEVAKDKAKPFKVSVNGMIVEALGTHFNVNAYTDEEATTTTLLEGRVKVATSKQQVIIMPGQQAKAVENRNLQINQHADIVQAIAWQKGMFEFNQMDLSPILRQLSRWYDVDIQFEGNIPNTTYSGGLSRYLPLSEVMKMMKANGVNSTLKGKTLTVRLN